MKWIELKCDGQSAYINASNLWWIETKDTEATGDEKGSYRYKIHLHNSHSVTHSAAFSSKEDRDKAYKDIQTFLSHPDINYPGKSPVLEGKSLPNG